MAHVDRSYHQAGYGYPSSDPPQLFHVEDAGWGHSTWTTPYVCVAHFGLMRMYALTSYTPGGHDID